MTSELLELSTGLSSGASRASRHRGVPCLGLGCLMESQRRRETEEKTLSQARSGTRGAQDGFMAHEPHTQTWTPGGLRGILSFIGIVSGQHTASRAGRGHCRQSQEAAGSGLVGCLPVGRVSGRLLGCPVPQPLA